MSAATTSLPATWLEQYGYFGGLDWGKASHTVVIVDRDGTLVLELCFANDLAGWQSFHERIAGLPTLAMTIETSSGCNVQRLLDLGCHVYPVTPTASTKFRTRKSPAGVKNDTFDAWCLSDALRTDGYGWRRLLEDEPLTQELRLLCRDEIALIEQRTGLVNQLQACLMEYYPTALKAFDDWTMPSAWEFLRHFSTPKILHDRGRRRLQNFLHANRLARPERLELLEQAPPAQASEVLTRVKSRLVLAIVAQLRALQAELDAYRKRINELFDSHPDRDIFGSLPGAGEKLAPRLLGECGDQRARFDSPEALQCMAGTAPVTKKSGQVQWVRQRRACNKTLRATMHHFANCSRRTCTWAETYYRAKRKEGKSHACALRCLAQRWLSIIWRMWQTRSPYDDALHMRNQARRGAAVLAPVPTPT